MDFWKDNEIAYQPDDDRDATLLYFSTGGGKSEGFFGLLVYALAFDRLRGKSRGITAAIRYPLRLLTSQQAFRLSQVLAAAQRVRWAWKRQSQDLKGQGFEIAIGWGKIIRQTIPASAALATYPASERTGTSCIPGRGLRALPEKVVPPSDVSVL